MPEIDLQTALIVASTLTLGALTALVFTRKPKSKANMSLPITTEGLKNYVELCDITKLKYDVSTLEDGSTLCRPYITDAEAEHPCYEDETAPFFNVDPEGQSKIVLSKSGLGAEAPRTTIELFRDAVKRHGPHTALVSCTGEKYSWQRYYDEGVDVAKALLKYGLKKGDSVNIIGFNSPEWVIMNVAAIFAGGKAAGVYTTNGPELCQYVAEASKAVVVCVQDVAQLNKYLAIRDQLPALKAIVMWEGEVPEGANDGEPAARVFTWSEFLQQGRDAEAEIGTDLTSRMDNAKPNDVQTLIFTSGTTGNPKAVMLTHDNVTWTAMAMFCSLGDGYGRADDPVGERCVSFLPLSHIAAQIVDIHFPIFCASSAGSNFEVHFADAMALKGTLLQSLQSARPTFFLAVPRVWEKFSEAMKAKGALTKGLKRKIVDWAKGKATENFINQQNGGSGKTPFMYGIAQILLNKVKTQIGLDQCKFASTAAAPIHKDVLNFFGALSIPIMEVYGMSESCGPQSITRPTGNAHLVGSTGPSMVGTEMKIMHDSSRDKVGEGEICYRGRHIMMGYMGNQEKTMESIDAEGWLHSGDVGRVDEHGMLFITGRIKELLITAGGENIPPVPIEEDIKAAAPAVSNFVVIGDQKKYLTALVTLKTVPSGDGTFSDELAGDALKVNTVITTASAAITDEAFKAHVQKGIDHYNAHAISNAAKVQYFTILPVDFSIPGGELGPTLKLRRSKVVEKYTDTIEAMYSK